jgi:flagellar assembly factor FliW
MTTMTDTGTRVHFIEPLPGFDGTDYTLDAIDDLGLLYSLRSVDAPELRFVLAAAPAFFPEYGPTISGTLAGPLGADEVDLLLVLTIATGLQDATANLRAPVALARTTGRAVQVVLDDDTLSMREPLISH